jgi:hypothetical protein
MEQTNNITLYDELSEEIFHSEKFVTYQKLIHSEILKELNLPGTEADQFTDEEINFLFQTASIFACSGSDKFKQLAYSIAILLYTRLKETQAEKAVNVISFLLIRLGNFPAFTLIGKTETIDFEENIPLSLQLETATKSLDNKIELAEKELYLTDFQKELFDALSTGKDFSFAAPTSAGKSFLLNVYLLDQLRKSDALNIVYIVPTKALINQVKNDLKANLESYEVKDVRVLSSTVSFEFEELYAEVKQNKHVLILTQERLSYLLAKKDLAIPIDILIIDEAQKINDGNRGVILERVILQTIAKYPHCKTIFSSPLASNPEFFNRFKGSVGNTKTNYSPVHQNVIFVRTKPKEPFLTLLDESEITLLKSSPLQKACPKTAKAKLSFIAYNLGKERSNILYGNGPADTEDLAKNLCTYLDDVFHPKITQFIEFIQENIHEEYSLVDCLKKGVAFHYSTMPRELKEKIEDLFKDEHVPVNYLCCTSTLLEGMNLPARNVFIFKPTKGSGNKMNKFDFWNLAGRAGRLLKDFYGNIFCIDVDQWGEDSYKPERSVENYEIISATENSVTTKSGDLSLYLEDVRHNFPSKERELLEQTTATFVLNYLADSGNTVRNYIATRDLEQPDSDVIQKADNLIKGIVERNRLPVDILEKNSGIDPRLQNELYQHFQTLFYTYHLPKYPASSEFYDSLTSIYTTIDRVFFNEADKKILKRYVYVSDRWVNETSLGQLIYAQIKYETTEEIPANVNACVRKVVDLIDRTITYKYAKYLKCYNDVLEYHLLQLKVEEKIVNLSTYLELGAFKPTTLSLLSFGLSRTTAIRLCQVIGDTNLDRTACRQWLDQYYERYKVNLPEICQEDFEKNFE